MIPEQFTATLELYEEYKSLMGSLPPDYYDDIDFYGLRDTIGEEWEERLNDSFSTEYIALTKTGIYFEGCQHSIYLKTYNDRLKKYIELHPDADETYFIRAEYAVVKDMRTFHYGTKEQLINQTIANDRRKEFLAERAKANGFTIGTREIINNDNRIDTNNEPAITVFGNYNYQLVYDIYEGIKGLLPPNVTKHDFARTFTLNHTSTNKIDLIGANVSTFAYLINSFHPFFHITLRDKGEYNQWWADRFTFNSSKRDRKGISTMCSAVNNGDKTPDKKGTIDDVVALLMGSNT